MQKVGIKEMWMLLLSFLEVQGHPWVSLQGHYHRSWSNHTQDLVGAYGLSHQF